MRKNLISIFLGFIFVSALALNAFARCGCVDGPGSGMHGEMMQGMGQPDMGPMHCRGGMPMCGMMMDDNHPMWRRLMDLGLDEKQEDAIKALRTKTMKEMVRKKADVQIADIELRNLLDKDPVDMKAVEAAVKKSESFRTAMFLARIGAREELKSILSPDQRKRLKEMMGHGPGCMMGDAEHMDTPMLEHMH